MHDHPDHVVIEQGQEYDLPEAQVLQLAESGVVYECDECETFPHVYHVDADAEAIFDEIVKGQS